MSTNWQRHQKYLATVDRVIDGDTIVVAWQQGDAPIPTATIVRLARIDAPELGNPPNRDAAASRLALAQMLTGRGVEIYPTKKHPDPYGRMVAEVLLGGTNASNAQMLMGHALSYRPARRRKAGSLGPRVPLTRKVNWLAPVRVTGVAEAVDGDPAPTEKGTRGETDQ